MTTTTSPLSEIRAPVLDDIHAVNQLIIRELKSQIPLIEQVASYIFDSGGKRLRPLIVLLSARALGYANDTEHQEVATIIEFLHTATLLHDDVIDGSTMRRGKQTANAVWGNQASVLVGDYLYSRAFQLMAKRNNAPVISIFANTTNAIAEGEILQLMNRNQSNISEADYMRVIQAKTAILYEAAAEIGAILANSDLATRQEMAKFGLNLGLAFQIIDDVLDYMADPDVLGKNLGDDLAEGKATLPLIYAAKNGSPKQQALIYEAIEKGGLAQFAEIMKAIKDTGAIEYCLQKAKNLINNAHEALAVVKPSQYKTALSQLLEFIVSRCY